MTNVIVCAGLINRIIGPEHQYLSHAEHVGLREIARLLGDGAGYGNGPLPTLLGVARAAAPDVETVLIGGRSSGLEDAIVDPIAFVAPSAPVVPSPEGRLPLRAIDDLVRERWPDAQRFLVAGAHTEREVAALASMLRSFHPRADVAVCQHLAATATPEAHFAALRHSLPLHGVEILLGFDEVASFLGLPPERFEEFGAGGIPIEPEEIFSSLDETRRKIVQSICMHWSRTALRSLGGGFSGSALFIAEGWKGHAKTEPMVVKIDSHAQMRQELEGYHQVKDLLGKHVPTFGYPVRRDDFLGVGMELAAMEGRPETLQESFETAVSDSGYEVFLQRLARALDMLTEKLYRNTSVEAWVVPYRTFGLHAEAQIEWLAQNAGYIHTYAEEAGLETGALAPGQLAQLLKIVGSNPDGLDSQVCVVHGDLNYANIISDAGENLWFIDWTMSRMAPIEMDFAKLENDLKFVISKEFEPSEIERLQKFEEYLLAGPVPGEIEELPDALRYARWDLRYRKILEGVRLIRRACLALTERDDWLVYRIALLRYAVHTLSWDLRRGRGECDLPQLLYALYSVEALLLELAADDFHLKIRAERARGYPERQRVSIDEASWTIDAPDYDPPYFVSDVVLGADRSRSTTGWADPEDVTPIIDDLSRRAAIHRDGLSRPLNPRGRTGICGRGALGRWGANRSVSVIAVRQNPASGEPDVLLGKGHDPGVLEVPKAFLRVGESLEDAARRIVNLETGWTCPEHLEPPVYEGYIYDARQTDHAWVETCAFLLEAEPAERLVGDRPGNPFSEIGWLPLDADTINRIPSVQAGLVREAVRRMASTNRMESDKATAILAATG